MDYRLGFSWSDRRIEGTKNAPILWSGTIVQQVWVKHWRRSLPEGRRSDGSAQEAEEVIPSAS